MVHATAPGPVRIARQLMERHGLRASAVAHEYSDEARAAGDAAGLHRWTQVQTAIAELRNSERNPFLPEPQLQF